MTYIDWTYYEQHGSGSVPQASFDTLAREATQQIDYVTFDRITPTTIPESMVDKVKECAVKLVEYLWDASQAVVPGRGVVSSERVANWSTNYSLPAEMSPANKDQTMYRICRRYLTRPINLMYAGGG